MRSSVMIKRPSTKKSVCSPTFWAWTASIFIHLIVLTVFGVVRFSQAKAQDIYQQVPTAQIRQVKKIAESALIIPKPKVKRIDSSYLAKPELSLGESMRYQIQRTRYIERAGGYELGSSGFSAVGGEILPSRIEFFGSWTEQRKVCYLVDCSGSMRGIFGRVRKELTDSIANLQPDQYFYVIFFGGDKLFEFGDGKLIRATGKAKLAAYDFIKSVRPAGATNAAAALERAMQIRDSGGRSASVIYFLTDGFELTAENAQRLPQRTTNLLKRFAPATKINTIGFWPAREDRRMLKTIAEQSGGQYIFIDE